MCDMTHSHLWHSSSSLKDNRHVHFQRLKRMEIVFRNLYFENCFSQIVCRNLYLHKRTHTFNIERVCTLLNVCVRYWMCVYVIECVCTLLNVCVHYWMCVYVVEWGMHKSEKHLVIVGNESCHTCECVMSFVDIIFCLWMCVYVIECAYVVECARTLWNVCVRCGMCVYISEKPLVLVDCSTRVPKLYILAKETCIHAKKPYTLAKELFIIHV